MQVNRDRAKVLLPSGLFNSHVDDLSLARASVRVQLAKLLGLPSQRTPLNDHILSSDCRRKLRVDEIEFESEPGIRIPGWFVRPKAGPAVCHTVLYITDGFVDEAVAEPSSLDEIFSHGNAICAINMRGLGLSIPRPSQGGPHFSRGLQLEDRFAWANMILGNPVIGQRVWDILRSVDYLRSRTDVDASQIRILGNGSAGLAAVMATALDDGVRSLLVNRMLATYLSVVKSEDYFLALDWFVPGILKHFDIPDITAAIYPRQVWMINALDANGVVLSEDAVRECFSPRVSAASPVLQSFRVQNAVGRDSEVYLDWLKNS